MTTDRAARPVGAAVVLAAALLWCYWPTLAVMAERWNASPEYSHGWLVPAFAGVLLWVRRDRLAGQRLKPSKAGLAFLAAAFAIRMVAVAVNFDYADGLSLLVAAAGVVLLAGGWRALAWAWPGVLFLVFMVPLPYRVETAFAASLQRVAAFASTHALQTLGVPAVNEGNVIVLDRVRMGVAEACSGLSMLMVFLALATAVAVLVRRPLLDRVVVLLSAVPVALVANVTRITATGVMHQTVGSKWADLVFHDLAGWLMMPFALGVLAAELWLLSVVLVEVPAAAVWRGVPRGVRAAG